MHSSPLQGYFADLMATSGAHELVLLPDAAVPSVSHMVHRRKRPSVRRNSPSFGPPSCPLRKASHDNLGAIKRSVRQQQQQQKKNVTALDHFYGEVAPQKPRGSSPPQLQKSLSYTKNNNTITNQVWKDDKTRRHSSAYAASRSSLFRGLVAEVLESTGSRNASPPLSSRLSESARRSVDDYIDEIETVVGLVAGSTPSSIMNVTPTKRDTRWMARPEVVGMEQQ